MLDVKLKMDLDVDGISARCDLCSWTWSSVDSSEYCAECRKILAEAEHSKAGVKVQCTTCSGTNGFNDCTTCNGTGKVMHTVCSGNGYTIENNNCGHEGANGPHYYCTEHGTNVEQYHK